MLPIYPLKEDKDLVSETALERMVLAGIWWRGGSLKRFMGAGFDKRT
jgi:transposase